MSFRSVFIALTIAFALILSALLIQRALPRVETDQPNADFVKATGRCACWSIFWAILHTAIPSGAWPSWRCNVISGAPLFAPLLLSNLAILGFLGLQCL
jgi:hypothetical protein